LGQTIINNNFPKLDFITYNNKKVVRANLIAKSTHSLVYSNPLSNYVLKARCAEKDINNSFSHYEEYGAVVELGLAPNHYILESLNILNDDSEIVRLEDVVIQEKVWSLSDLIQITYDQRDFSTLEKHFIGFIDLHIKLMNNGYVDKLFYTGLHDNLRKYFANIGLHPKTKSYVHFDLADLSVYSQGKYYTYTGLLNLERWFPIDDRITKWVFERIIKAQLANFSKPLCD